MMELCSSPVCSPQQADKSVPVKQRTDSRRCLCRHLGPCRTWPPMGWRRGWGSCSSCVPYSAQRLSYWSRGWAGLERRAEDTGNSNGHSHPAETKMPGCGLSMIYMILDVQTSLWIFFRIMTNNDSIPGQRGSYQGREALCKPGCTRWWTTRRTQSLNRNKDHITLQTYIP